MSKLLIGETRPAEIWVGEQEVKQIYLGEELVWERVPDIWTLYNAGEVNGVTWKANSMTTGGNTNASTKNNSSYLLIYSSSNAVGNWITSSTIRIPRQAKYLELYFNTANSAPDVNFGLILPNASSGVDVSKGGQLYGWQNNVSGYTTFKMTIQDDLKGSSKYKVAVSGRMQASVGNRQDLNIRRVRFLDENNTALN